MTASNDTTLAGTPRGSVVDRYHAELVGRPSGCEHCGTVHTAIDGPQPHPTCTCGCHCLARWWPHLCPPAQSANREEVAR